MIETDTPSVAAGPIVSPAKRVTAQILLFLMLVACIALLISATGFRQRLEAVRSADTDNQGWIVAQLEVDHQGLLLALEEAAGEIGSAGSGGVDAATLARVKQEFDIFYSRVDVMVSSLRGMAILPELEGMLSRLIQTRDRLAAQIDAITEPDPAALMQFRSAVRASYPLIRDVSVGALQEFVRETTQARREEERQFVRFFIQSLALFVLMGIGTFLVVRLWRELEARTAETARVAATLSKAFNSTLNAVIVTDLQSRILYCNDMAEKIFGYRTNQMIGARIEDVLVPEHMLAEHRAGMERFRHEDDHHLIGKGPTVVMSKRADGREIPVEVSLVSDTDISGRPVIIGFVRDISQQVAAEEKLRDALKQAEQAAQAKSMFLATMSHEMRTPLHGLMASLGLIDESGLDSGNRGLLKTARDCSARALAQVNDVLELTQLGESREAPQGFSPAGIAADIVDELQPLALKRNNRLRLVTRGTQELCPVEGLPIAFSRALYNLAGNAVKFTRGGQITISLDMTCDDPERMELTVAVEDTGIGIAPEDQARIFQNFETAGRSEISASTGTGLGLPIARLAIEQQGGTLRLHSQPGVGSRFYFTIPLRPAAAPVQPAPAAPGLQPGPDIAPQQVLVVEDNEVNLTLMCEMVRRLGHHPDAAQNGGEAVEKARGRRYDTILMDFSMPVMDGPAAALAIRQGGGASAGAVIIGVTALIEASTRDARAAAMDQVLIKPVSQEQLDHALRSVTHGPGSVPARAEALAPAAAEGAAHTLEELCGLVGRDTAVRLVRAALADADLAVKAMSAADLPLAEKGATIHRAAGSTGVIGLLDMSELLSEAEGLTLRGRDPRDSALPDSGARLLQKICAAYQPVLDRMSAEA